MDAKTFKLWLLDMKVSNLAETDAACGRLLGLSPDTIVRMKEHGADKRTALACRALIHRMEPYTSPV